MEEDVDEDDDGGDDGDQDDDDDYEDEQSVLHAAYPFWHLLTKGECQALIYLVISQLVTQFQDFKTFSLYELCHVVASM